MSILLAREIPFHIDVDTSDYFRDHMSNIDLGLFAETNEDSIDYENVKLSVYSLVVIFKRDGLTESLEAAILRAKEWVASTAENHRDRPQQLRIIVHMLAEMTQIRVATYSPGKLERILTHGVGIDDDLDYAISLARRALDCTAYEDHTERIAISNNLGAWLGMRFDSRGDLEDLTNAIQIISTVLEDMPRGHVDLVVVSINLGTWLGKRYKRTRSLSDLNYAIDVGKNALGEISEHEPHRITLLINLAHRLEERFERTSNLADIDGAIEAGQTALQYMPPDDPDHALVLFNLGSRLGMRSEVKRSWDDLIFAIDLLEITLGLNSLPFNHQMTAQNNLSILRNKKLYWADSIPLGPDASQGETLQDPIENIPKTLEDSADITPQEGKDHDATRPVASAQGHIHIGNSMDRTDHALSSSFSMLQPIGTIEDEEAFDTNSDCETIDDGPIALPQDIEPDLHLTNPSQWNQRLDGLERSIVEKSKTCISIPDPKSVMEIDECISMLDTAYENYQTLVESKYCQDSINVVIANRRRLNVANLEHISGEDIFVLQQHIKSRNTEPILKQILDLGLIETWDDISKGRDGHDRASTCATVVARFIDLAIVCFSGAHIERFDQKYLKLSEPQIMLPICGTIMLRQRSLQCLDEYLDKRQIWVFEDVKDLSEPHVDSPLFISTTILEFDRVWGSVLAIRKSNLREDMTLEPEQNGAILGYRVGRGCIIPWEWDAAQPELLEGEVFAHWTQNKLDLDWRDFKSDRCFPYNVLERRLLIGAGPKLYENRECGLNIDDWTAEKSLQKQLQIYGTREESLERDSQTISVTLSGLGLGVGYSEPFKIREGSTLKDRLLVTWINNPKERNSSIMAHRLGVEVSACTGHARRRRLARILGSKTIRNYLASVSFKWGHAEAEQLYFSALNDRDIRAFERLYYRRVDLREDLGNAVAISFEALRHTGIDNALCLRTFWSRDNRTQWTASFPHSKNAWSGLLADTTDTCTVATVTEHCLILKRSEHSNRLMNTHSGNTECSLLETAMVINQNALRGDILFDRNDQGWQYQVIELEKKFNLGPTGELEFRRRISDSRGGILMAWNRPRVLEMLHRSWLEIVRRNGTPPHHREHILDDDEGFRPVKIHVLSR